MKQLAKMFFAAWIVLVSTMPTHAHGVRISHTTDATTGEITVTAAFDTGEVLDNAAVVIFAPDDLINPWATGVMDENGSYTFVPDYTIEGFWDIQVRKAGHGGLINVEITQDMIPDTTSREASPLVDGMATTITLSDGSEVVIIGDVDFSTEGDVVVFETQQSVAQAGGASVQAASDASSAMGFSIGQIVIMSLGVTWGFVGTALYFMRNRPKMET